MLQVESLVYTHPGSGPLRFPDLSAEQGDQVLLRGPSGSGKSTLVALLAGLLRHQQGTLRVGDADLARLDPRQVDAWRGAQVGLVPQRLHLSAGLDVTENLALAYRAAGRPVDAARIAALLDRLDLQALARRRPHEISVGQAQRVALARAVLRGPRLLLADEPTAHLDDEAAARALTLLQQIAGEHGATLVVATHDARVRERMAAARDWSLAPVQAPA